MFLLEMSGVPGSGKSTVAAHVVDTYGAVAVDYDVIKSAGLDACLRTGGEVEAGRTSRPGRGLRMVSGELAHEGAC
jgi:predicted kinase